MSELQRAEIQFERLEQSVQDALDAARAAGATGAEASASAGQGLSVNVRLGEVETLEYHKDQGVAVTVYIGKQKGSASTSDLKPEAIREAAKAACRIARQTAEDDCHGLADPARMAMNYPDLDLDHPWQLTGEQAIDLARSCEEAARRADQRIVNSEGAGVDSYRGTSVYGNTNGFIGGYSGTRHSLSCSVIGEQDGAMQRDYWYSVARNADLLESAEAVGAEAARRTVARLGGRRLGTRKAPVVFTADLARGLLGHLVSAVRGAALYRKASFLLDHLGRPVFPDGIRVYEEPHLPGALGSAPFDSEGVATQARDLVHDGRLEGYVLDSYSACRLGMQTTGNAGGVHNLGIDAGQRHDLAGLLGEMGTGLLVTELIGHGINMVTGDYSRGAAGFWVENGELQYAVEEITVAGSLKDMFMGLAAVGTDTDLRGNIRTGSWLLNEMTIAGE